MGSTGGGIEGFSDPPQAPGARQAPVSVVRSTMDVHVRQAVTEALRLRGVEVVTAQADNAARLLDPQLLDRAMALGRVLFTQDEDLLAEATRRQRAGESFAGVVYAHQFTGEHRAVHRQLGVDRNGDRPGGLAQPGGVFATPVNPRESRRARFVTDSRPGDTNAMGFGFCFRVGLTISSLFRRRPFARGISRLLAADSPVLLPLASAPAGRFLRRLAMAGGRSGWQRPLARRSC